jgi:hypothetical protein
MLNKLLAIGILIPILILTLGKKMNRKLITAPNKEILNMTDKCPMLVAYMHP